MWSDLWQSISVSYGAVRLIPSNALTQKLSKVAFNKEQTEQNVEVRSLERRFAY